MEDFNPNIREQALTLSTDQLKIKVQVKQSFLGRQEVEKLPWF